MADLREDATSSSRPARSGMMDWPLQDDRMRVLYGLRERPRGRARSLNLVMLSFVGDGASN